MSRYISESYRYYEVAERALNNYSDNKDAYVCIVFSAMYIEGVINDLIFSEKLDDRILSEYKKISSDEYYDFDLYYDKISFDFKLNAIFNKYSFFEYKKDKVYPLCI